MPELPEVETVRKGLEIRLKDFRIKDLTVLSNRSISSKGGAETFISHMKGLTIGKWTRRGKYLICSLHSQNNGEISGWWVVHLRMTGQFQWFDKKHAICSHTRVQFWNHNGAEIRFVDTRNFGEMWWVPPDFLPEHIVSGLLRLGPEPFSKEFNASYLHSSLIKRKRSIKSSLLDQSIVAGVGNIYADESLFEAGIIPTRTSNKLDQKELAKLCDCLITVLKLSIGKGGTTFRDFRDLEGLNGNYGGQAWVYGRGNMPCKKCGAKIIKEKICGRGTHWCPNCQK